jgi:TolA-binding protein
MPPRKASSSSFSRSLRLVSAGALLFPALLAVQSSAETVKLFPVLGQATVSEGHWNEVPGLLTHLADQASAEPIRFELLSASAEQYFQQGLLEESRRGFEKLLKARKPSPSVFIQDTSRLRVAEVMLLEGRPDEALKELDPMGRDSNPYMADEALFLQARCYLYKRDWEKENSIVTKLLRQNPAFSHDLALNLMRGVAALEQGHFDQAVVYFEKYPDEPSALYYRSICYIRKKEISSALPFYQQIIQKDQSSEWVDRLRLALGEAFYQAHDLVTARQFFQPVTRPQAEPPLRALALHREVCIDFEQKNFKECETLLPLLLKQYPNHALRGQWTYLYASVPIFKRDWKKAIQEQKLALEEERGLAPRLHGLDAAQLKQSMEFRILWAHLLLNDFSGCIRMSDSFIAHYPKEPVASYALLAKGLSLYRVGEYDRALEVYQSLLNQFPDSSACGKAVYLMTLCLHSARDPFRMAGILNEVHLRMQQAANTENAPVDEWTQNTLYWVADAYYQINDWASAEKIFREFILRAPQSPLVPYALEGLGSTLSAQGPQRDGEAVIAMQQAELRALDLGNKEFAQQVDLELAKVYYNQREFAKAGALWDHLVQTSTFTAVRDEALFREGDALSRQDYYKEAIKRWQSLVKSFKGSPWAADAMMRAGNTQAGLGEWEAAAQTFRNVRNTFPGSEVAKEGSFQLVQCSFNEGNFPLAVTELLDYAKQYPDDGRISKTADNLLSAFHQRKLNIPAQQQAALLKLAPGSAGGAALLWERGAQLFNEGRYAPAQKLFEKIMLSYPNDEYAPLAYFYNADCFFWLQNWDDAANAYQNFYLSFPKHERVPNAMFQKAVCLFRKGTYDDAVKDFQAFLDKFPKHALAKEAWLNIALARKKAFQLDKAVVAYQYVIDHYPGDPKINAVWLQLGSLLEVQGKRTEALRTYARIPATAPEYAEGLYRRSLLYEQVHNAVQTQTVLEQLRQYPEKRNEFRVAALVKLSEIYEQQSVPTPKLKVLYEDLRTSSSDPEIVKQASLRLKELGQ